MNKIEKRVLYIEAYFANDIKQCGTGVLLHCQNDQQCSCDIIVTCLHVVELESTKELAIEVKVWPTRVGFGDRTARSVKIHSARIDDCCEDAKDLVLLEQKKAVGFDGVVGYSVAKSGQKITVCGFPWGEKFIVDLNDNKVEPCIIDGKVHSCSIDSIYTLQADSAKGVSGGPVFSRGKLVGILRGRWAPQSQEYSQGIAIGMHWINKLCEKAGYRLSTKITPPQVDKQAIEKAKDRVKLGISKILRKKKELEKSLAHKVEEFYPGNKRNLVEVLVDSSLLEVTHLVLRVAVVECIENLQDKGAEYQQIKQIWESGVSILGWLVLLAVDYNWINDNAQKDLENIKLSIPATTTMGAEIAFSSIRGSQANLDVSEKGPASKYGILCATPEVGWENEDHIIGIKQLLWKKAYPADSNIPIFADDKEGKAATKKLDTTLRLRGLEQKSSFLIADTSEMGNPLNDEEIYTKLKGDLPNLHIVFILIDAQEEIFIVSEPELEALLIEFFNEKPN